MMSRKDEINRMSRYKSDEIKGYVRRLQEKGAIGDSNTYNGISPADELHLISLIIQSTPDADLPTLHELDVHNGLSLMIARYIDSCSTEMAIELATYIKNLYVDHYKIMIKQLMEEKIYV